jgi:hypothetical protein
MLRAKILDGVARCSEFTQAGALPAVLRAGIEGMKGFGRIGLMCFRLPLCKSSLLTLNWRSMCFSSATLA